MRRVLAGVLRAFDPAETDSRLLVTSRFTFTLDGLAGPAGDGAAAAAVRGGPAQAAAPPAGPHPRRSAWPSGPGWPRGRWR